MTQVFEPHGMSAHSWRNLSTCKVDHPQHFRTLPCSKSRAHCYHLHSRVCLSKRHQATSNLKASHLVVIMASSGPLNVAVPVRLDAFVLTPTVCDSDLSKISPLTQPNYTRLRYEDSLIEHDVMPHHDIHAATPHSLNSRVTDLSNGDLRNNRFGVYLHWVLPRMYRSGTAATDSAAEAQGAKKQREGFPSQTSSSSKHGQPPKPTSAPDYTSPDFRSAPNRWLVIRRLTSPVNHVIPEFQGWILESDFINSLDDFDDEKDIEVEVSPFIDPTKPPSQQSDCFLGRATDCSVWNETAKAGDSGRADLSLLASSNHLFADYQPHNGGVFSILDNFQYKNPDPNSPDDTLYLSEATASYYVLGWHADPATANLDPLYIPPGSTEMPTNADRLRACFMQLAGDPVDSPEDHPEIPNGEFPPATGSVEDVWLKSSMDPSHPSKVINHGAIYDVKFKLDSKPSATPADDVARDVKENVAVGTTTLDSLLAFVSSKIGPPPSTTNVTNTSAVDVTEIETDLYKLSTLLIKADDNVDSQLQAEDAMYEANFSRTSGGSTWNFAGSSSTPEKPAPSTEALTAAKHKHKQNQPPGGPQASSVPLALNKRPDPATPLGRLFDLNLNQAALDLCQREVQALQWKIFAQWWNFIAEPAEPADPKVNVAEITKNQVAAYVQRLQLLQGCVEDPASKGRIGDLQKTISGLLAQLQDPVEKGIADTFYRQKDPTVFIAGVPSGWPEHFVDYNTKVRLDTQLITGFQEGISIPPWPGLDTFAAQVLPKLPTTLQKTAKGLIGEFRLLQYQPIPSGSEPPKRQGNQRFPSFHDESGVGGVPQSDSWGDRQPWFPLFIEWEAVYYHIPFSTWKLSDSTSLMGQNVPRWGINPNVWLQSNKDSSGQPVDYAADSRTLSGRILILPQPTYSLRTNIHQVFQNTDNDTLKAVGFDDITKRRELERNVDLLPFVSAPLSGFNDHLLTLVQGTHIKPSLRGPGGVPTAIQEACAKDAGFSADVINAMGSQTDRTPYGNLVALDSSKESPFKPGVHGQVEFTKLNIIDKFGQVVCAIDQAPSKPENKKTLSPAISDFYKPSLGLVPSSSDYRPDTVRREVPGQNSFFQLPPYLNQDARLNTYFVVSDDANKGVWRPVSEHESPLWGWIVVNYAEYGLQIFLADGTFYREVRLRDQGLGAVLSPKWLPFEPPAIPTDSEKTTQLDKLIARLLDATNNYAYLHGIFNMINQSMDSMPSAPQSYAGFLPGLVGKPLALVNVGFSLELAGYPLENQSTAQVPVDLPILQYCFPIKVGDKLRAFDGLVGYFNAVKNASGEVDLDLSTLLTYFPSSDLPSSKVTGSVKSTFSAFPNVPSKAATTTNPDPTKKISADEDTYTRLKPYYSPTSVLPADTTRVPPKGKEIAQNDANQIRLIHNRNLTVIGAIIDPFRPIHFYPAILPVKQLQLPPWTVEAAMKQMTAFFHMGPLLLTKDVKPTFTPAKKLDAGYNLQTSKQYIVSQHDLDPAKDANTPYTVAMPTLSAADWNWLQPYWVEEPAFKPKPDSGPESGYKTELNAYELDKNVVMTPKFEPGPYTAVEGYLQLTQPMVRPDH